MAFIDGRLQIGKYDVPGVEIVPEKLPANARKPRDPIRRE